MNEGQQDWQIEVEQQAAALATLQGVLDNTQRALEKLARALGAANRELANLKVTAQQYQADLLTQEALTRAQQQTIQRLEDELAEMERRRNHPEERG